MGSLYFFFFLSLFLLFFLCCSHCLSFAPDLCLLLSASLFSVLFPSPCPLSHPVSDLSLSSSTPNVSLSGVPHLPHSSSLASLCLYLCVSISRTLHPLSLLYFSFTFLSFIWAHIPLLPHLKFSLNDSKCLGPVPP